MSTLNLEETPASEPISKAPLVLRTILITVLTIAVIGSAVANGYFYFEYQATNEKLNGLQGDIQSIKTDLGKLRETKITKFEKPDLGFPVGNDLESQITRLSEKIDEIGDDVSSIKSDVSSIESEVSAIQIKIGY